MRATDKFEYMNIKWTSHQEVSRPNVIMKKLGLKSQAEKCYMLYSSVCTTIPAIDFLVKRLQPLPLGQMANFESAR